MAEIRNEPGRAAAQNRRARHDYFIEDTVEAGIILTGTEVKSLRTGQASIAEAFAREQDGELYLMNAHIPEYRQAHRLLQHEVKRPRKLLLHRKEMSKLMGSIKREGITIIPLSVYFNPRGIAKVELGLAKGKRKEDKREADKARDWSREKARLLRNKG
jgi:SsrA-binding protein